MEPSILTAAKENLIESAKSQYGNIAPCGDNPFTEYDDMLFYWFDTPDQSTHMKHTHLIHTEN